MIGAPLSRPKILVVDREPDLAAQVEAAAARLRPVPEVVPWGRLGSVGEVVAEQGPFAVVVAGPSLANRSGLKRLASIHELYPSASILLAFSDRPDSSLREIIQSGAEDLLHLPAANEAVTTSLARSLAISARRGRGTAVDGSIPGASPAPTLGRVFAVGSATGGCGKTFYATNMALFLARNTRKRVILVDLDLQFGEVSTALRLRPAYTIHDALRRGEGGGEGDLAQHLAELLVTHETGISVLAAPKDPMEADGIAPSDVTRILEVLRTQADYVIVDTPAALTEIVLAAFDLSEHLFVLATVDLPSVRNLGVFLQTLERLRVPSDNVSLILNKAERDVGLDVGQIVRLFPQGFRSILPYAREVSRSINLGMPVIASDPSAEVSRKLVSGLSAFFPSETGAKPDVVPLVRPRGRFVNLVQRCLALTGGAA